MKFVIVQPKKALRVGPDDSSTGRRFPQFIQSLQCFSFIGRKGGKEGLEKRFGKGKMQKVYDRVERYGFGMVFVSAILPPPMPTVPFVLAAGALKYGRAKFVAAFTLGRILRYGIEAYAASIYGKQILGFLTRYERPLLWIFVAFMVAGALAGIFFWQRHRRMSSREPSKLAA